MAYTLDGEYKRLENLIKKNSGRLPFECGCACGEVVDLELVEEHYDQYARKWIESHINVIGNAGLDYASKPPVPRTLFTITSTEAQKGYKTRCYRYDKEFNILEYFERR
ncbi:MAG: hypothetical protein J5525_13535 [Lachnospiraceae bacterium]|nr:hypothetical protein [Lachnospiraceae bacterium]